MTSCRSRPKTPAGDSAHAQSLSRHEEAEKGRFWRRLAARLIDVLIMSVASVAVLVVLLQAMGRIFPGPGLPLTDISPLGFFLGLLLMPIIHWAWVVRLVWPLAILIVSAPYQVLFIGRYGQTPGKMAAKVKVVPAAGGKMTYGRAALRWLAWDVVAGVVNLFPLFYEILYHTVLRRAPITGAEEGMLLVRVLVYLVYALWVACHSQKQGLHDKIASTYVIRA